MAVIINELEVVLEPQPPAPPATKPQEQEKGTLNPFDLLTVIDREKHEDLRLRAH